MSIYKVTACTTMGHLLDLNHNPETIQAAHQWAWELSRLPCIRHVTVTVIKERVEAVHQAEPESIQS